MTSKEAWQLLLVFTGGDEIVANQVLRLADEVNGGLAKEGVSFVGGGMTAEAAYEAHKAWYWLDEEDHFWIGGGN